MFVITNEPVLIQPKLNFIFYLNSTSFPPLCPLAVPVWWFGIREKKTMNCSPLNPIPSRTPFTLSCHVSLDSKKMFLMTLTIPDTGQVYCRMSLNLGLPDVCSWLDSGYTSLWGLWQKWHCTLHSVRWNVISVHPVTGDVRSDRLTKVICARLLHCEIILCN